MGQEFAIAITIANILHYPSPQIRIRNLEINSYSCFASARGVHVITLCHTFLRKRPLGKRLMGSAKLDCQYLKQKRPPTEACSTRCSREKMAADWTAALWQRVSLTMLLPERCVRPKTPGIVHGMNWRDSDVAKEGTRANATWLTLIRKKTSAEGTAACWSRS